MYSYNLAVQTNKKSVLIVANYEDYFKLAGKGIFNLVSTYFPKIIVAQLNLLKQKFKVIMVLAPQHFNIQILPAVFCFVEVIVIFFGYLHQHPVQRKKVFVRI